MAIEQRKCICGCNKEFYGTKRRVYFNAACEARYRRKKKKDKFDGMVKQLESK